MKQKLLSTLTVLILTLPCVLAQVGIGTTDPKAFFHVPQGRTIMFGEDSTISTAPMLIWYGSKGAFRAGGIVATLGNIVVWWSNNVGMYSFAIGAATRAIGERSVSMGYQTAATAN